MINIEEKAKQFLFNARMSELNLIIRSGIVYDNSDDIYEALENECLSIAKNALKESQQNEENTIQLLNDIHMIIYQLNKNSAHGFEYQLTHNNELRILFYKDSKELGLNASITTDLIYPIQIQYYEKYYKNFAYDVQLIRERKIIKHLQYLKDNYSLLLKNHNRIELDNIKSINYKIMSETYTN